MGKEIDSEALVLLRKGLGIGGVASPSTILEEDSVVQTVDVGQFARQGLPPGDGLFYYFLRVITSVANPTLEIAVDVYNPDATLAGITGAPYPGRVSSQFDIHLIHVTMHMSNTTINACNVSLQIPLDHTAISISNNDTTDAPGPFVAQNVFIAAFDSVIAVGTQEMGNLGDSGILQKINMRVPRGAILGVTCDAGGINTFNFFFLAALMPRAMGQDVGF